MPSRIDDLRHHIALLEREVENELQAPASAGAIASKPAGSASSAKRGRPTPA